MTPTDFMRRDLRGMSAGWARLDGGCGEILQYVSAKAGVDCIGVDCVVYLWPSGIGKMNFLVNEMERSGV